MDLALNNLQWLMFHKTQLNQTKSKQVNASLSKNRSRSK